MGTFHFYYPEMNGEEMIKSIRGRREGYKDKVLSLFSRLCGYDFEYFWTNVEADLDAWDERIILRVNQNLSMLAEIAYNMENFGLKPVRSTDTELWYDFDDIAKITN